MRLKKSSQTLTRPVTTLAGLAVLVLTMSAFAAAQKESTIYSFKAGHDGAYPEAALVADSAGNLYGTTSQGGGSINCGANGHKPIGCGTVYELTPTQTGGHWTETILYAFQGGTTDGVGPATPLVFDAAGNLYGATLNGGASGLGTIFELSPPAQQGGAWTEGVLHSFGADGGPRGLVFDPQGNLYGEANGDNNDGEIFELSPPAVQGGAWTFSILCSFTGPNGSVPLGGLTLDAHGNLYGTTYAGGTGTGAGCPGGTNCGLVFELLKPATQGGPWTENVLHYFTGANGDGSSPDSSVIFHNGNHLYGTTAYGGNDIGDGAVFELLPAPGGGWTETTLYQFDRNTGGFRPDSGVLFDHQGNLYGTTSFSPNGQGEAFKLAPPAVQGDPWSLTLLHDFSCGNDGCSPLSRLIFDKANVLYGTAGGGGIGHSGVVFGIIP
jgi:uncharacterized repeat protein (TIGR03803 family)